MFSEHALGEEFHFTAVARGSRLLDQGRAIFFLNRGAGPQASWRMQTFSTPIQQLAMYDRHGHGRSSAQR
jgi:hypothetical protein